MVANSRFHSRSYAQSLVNATKVVKHEVKRQCRDVILYLLAECVCKPLRQIFRKPECRTSITISNTPANNGTPRFQYLQLHFEGVKITVPNFVPPLHHKP